MQAKKEDIIGSSSLRLLFPALSALRGGRKLVYLDNACSVLKPECVIKAAENWLCTNGSCGGSRSAHILAAETDSLCSSARAEVARFIGYSAAETVFTANATHSINLIAYAFPFKPERNEVIVFAGSHHSLLLPFLEAEKKGRCKLKIAGLNSALRLPEQEICELISEKTALLALPMASNITGAVFELNNIIKKAHAYGALVLADAAAFLACHKPPWGGKEGAEKPDFLAFSGHKIGALPSGVLGICKKRFSLLNSFMTGGGTISLVSASAIGLNAEYLSGYKRFEAGIQNYPGIISFGKAAKFISSLNREAIFLHICALSKRLARELSHFSQIGIVDEALAEGSSIVSFYFKNKNIDAQDFSIFLSAARPWAIALRIGHHCAMPALKLSGINHTIRASLYAYNTKEDIDALIELLLKFCRTFN